MSKPGYLVEGDLEQKFIQNACPGAPVKKINCNGDHTSIEAIAKRVGSLARLLHKRHSPIVVVFDRERRSETPQELETLLREFLNREEINVPVIVGIPDRSVESWILADYAMFIESAGLSSHSPLCGFEGQDGKSVIRRALGKGRTYVETIDGVEWLKAARPAIMKENSPSFARIFDALVSLDCWWLKQLQLPLTQTLDSVRTDPSPGSDACSCQSS